MTMSVFIIILILFSITVFVLEPYYSGAGTRNKFISRREQRRRDMLARFEFLDAGLKDLDLEHGTGMVSDEDFRLLKADYDKKIAALRSEMSASGVYIDETVDDAVEAEIRQRKITPDVQGKKDSAVNFCPKCGAKAGQDSNFCAKCGAKLT